jgi:hypothetical protein
MLSTVETLLTFLVVSCIIQIRIMGEHNCSSPLPSLAYNRKVVPRHKQAQCILPWLVG